MRKPSRSVVLVAVVAVVVIGGTVLGRDLIAASSGVTSAPPPARSSPGSSAPSPSASGSSAKTAAGEAHQGALAVPSLGAPTATGAGTANAPASSDASSPGVASTSSTSGSGALPPVPEFPTSPQIVRTATVDVRVSAGAVRTTLADITALAVADDGYVQSSSMTGGTARTDPVSGAIVVHVLDADFSAAVAQLSSYGKVTSQQIAGNDVTDEVAANAATLQVLQEEVNLLQSKLSHTSDINTFLEIEDQLFPVEQQLQQLENQQAVLESSAAYGTITVDLAAPGAPAPVPETHTRADAAVRAWRYLRHNALAVLDGLAVGLGWALPLLVLLGIAWAVTARYRRRRRQAVSPA